MKAEMSSDGVLYVTGMAKRADEKSPGDRHDVQETLSDMVKRAEVNEARALELIKSGAAARGLSYNAFLDTAEGKSLKAVAVEARAMRVNGAGAVKKGIAYDALAKALGDFCKKHSIAKVWTDGLDRFVETDDGRALYDAYQDAK